jgi:hypothetical protein
MSLLGDSVNRGNPSPKTYHLAHVPALQQLAQ